MKEIVKYVKSACNSDMEMLASLVVLFGVLALVPALTWSATESGYAVVLAILLEVELTKYIVRWFRGTGTDTKKK